MSTFSITAWTLQTYFPSLFFYPSTITRNSEVNPDPWLYAPFISNCLATLPISSYTTFLSSPKKYVLLPEFFFLSSLIFLQFILLTPDMLIFLKQIFLNQSHYIAASITPSWDKTHILAWHTWTVPTFSASLLLL